jgi:hypothetical protein
VRPARHRRGDKLRNAHAAGDDERLAAEIDQDHLDLAAEIYRRKVKGRSSSLSSEALRQHVQFQ